MQAAAVLARWSALSPGVRRSIAGAAFAIAAASIILGLVSHPSRVALFVNPLRADQLSEVQEQLASWNVPFTPVSDNLYVEAKRRNELILRLSFAGLPHGHIGTSSETLTNVGALSPQAVIDAQARSGLAGDVALGLRGIDGIQDARVIIAPAKPGVFADEPSRDATASVRLEMRPGFHLSRDAVTGIRAFVAASVTGVDPARVTILDGRGLALGEASAASDDARDVQQSVQSVLDTALGAGAAIARIRFSDGRVHRMSAAVLVDSARAADGLNVRSLIAAASGFQAARGDTIEIATVPFEHRRSPKRDGWWLAYGAVVPLLPALVPALIVLLVLRCALQPLGAIAGAFVRRMDRTRLRQEVSGLGPAQVRGALRDEPAHAAAAIISALPAATAAAVLDLYPAHERSAIIRRMSRPQSPLIPEPEAFVGRA